MLVTTVKLESAACEWIGYKGHGAHSMLYGTNTEDVFLSPLPPFLLRKPSNRGSPSTKQLFCLTVMCIACLCLNSKLAFLLFILLFLPVGRFPPLYLAGQIVKIQCNAECAYSKGGNKNDDDVADVFIQFCSSTEDRELEGFEGKEDHPAPAHQAQFSISSSPAH